MNVFLNIWPDGGHFCEDRFFCNFLEIQFLSHFLNFFKLFFFFILASWTQIYMYMKKEFESDTPNVDFSSPSKKVSPPALRIFGEESKQIPHPIFKKWSPQKFKKRNLKRFLMRNLLTFRNRVENRNSCSYDISRELQDTKLIFNNYENTILYSFFNLIMLCQTFEIS